MSTPLLFRWRDAVRTEHGPPATTRYVLLALSLHADSDGGSCYPSTRRLAKETGLSRTCVLKHLDDAERGGWIRRNHVGTDRGKGWKRFEYQLTVPEVVNDVDHDSPKVVNEDDHVGGQRRGPRSDEGGQPHDEGGQPHVVKVVNDVDQSTSKSPPKSTSSPPEGNAGASAPDGKQVESMKTNTLVAEWINRQTARPPTAAVQKQGAAAKRLVAAYSRPDLESALDGIGRLYPFSDGTPWDLFTLEKKMAVAVNAPARNGNAGGLPAEVDHEDLESWRTP